jgi:hypothetical protein
MNFPKNNTSKWNEIAQQFNERFPEIQPKRSSRDLQNHYFQSLDSSINREAISTEEHKFIIQYVSEKWKHCIHQQNFESK